VSVPLYLPRDQAIPAPEVPARAQFTRAFILDHKNLQREKKENVAGWLTTAAYLVVLVIVLGFFALLAWALTRLGGAEDERVPRTPQPVHKKDPSFA
jgi:cytochrome c-type biogenesis protein CcmH/NrfG